MFPLRLILIFQKLGFLGIYTNKGTILRKVANGDFTHLTCGAEGGSGIE